MPAYAVRREIDERRLLQVEGLTITPEKFGVYWPSGRKDLEPWAQRAQSWLEGKDLQ
ncbi:MAG: hypothetical protein LC775_10210 [Acidobacteria bacterium]|nr:hypothetical protein [Acidobacteriota bacterium]